MAFRSKTIRLAIFISTFVIAAIVIFQLVWLRDVYYHEQKEFDKAIAKTVRGFYEDIDEPFHLIVWNDDVNTFEWVIETLMEICKHSYEQAEQCAYIIHFKGKYAVKHGSYDDLKPMCEAITERGIGATLETVPV